MTTRLDALCDALDEIPEVLVDDGLRRAINDARGAIDTLATMIDQPTLVVVSGASGSGKSTLVNALVGVSVVPVSPVRPTTTQVVAIGGPGATEVAEAAELVITDALPPGLVIVDTPSWDRAPDVVEALMARAVLSIIMVTPARYGDQATSDAIAAARSSERLDLVANRLPADAAQRTQIEDAIHERLDIEPLATFAEGEEIRFQVSPIEKVEVVDTQAARRTIVETSTAGICRTIAERITAMAPELGAIEQALAGIDPVPTSDWTLDLAAESWDSARAELVNRAVRSADDVDRSVADTVNNSLVKRLVGSLGPVEVDDIRLDLDAWREGVEAAAGAVVRPRFRKAHRKAVVAAHAWKLPFDGLELPRAGERLLKGDREELAYRARTDLVAILAEVARSRHAAWMAAVERAGGYRPGRLYAAASALAGAPSDDG